MSLTGSMVLNITACGRLSFYVRCKLVEVLIKMTAYVAHYQLLINLDGRTLGEALCSSPAGTKFQVEVKEGFDIVEVTKV